jgi:RimJ/RimL family protein N-acetyltransferase
MALPIDRAHPPARVVYDDGATWLTIRPWDYADIDALIDAVNASAPALRGYMPWAHTPPTREGEHALVTRFRGDYFAGRDLVVGLFGRSGEVLGGAGLHARTPLNPRALEVGYWTHSAHAGRGVATLATRVLVALAFDRLGCDRFQVMHDVTNVASRRVVEKCGFVYEGTMRRVVSEVAPEIRAGGYLGTGDARMYGMLADDFARLPWVAGVRAATTLVDVFGAEERLG